MDNATEVPRSRADAWSLEFPFSPAELLGGERRGWLPWLGMPTLWGSYRYDRLKPVSVPASFETGLLADPRTDSDSATVAFQYDRWTWSISHSILDTDERTASGISSVIRSTEIRIAPSARLGAAPWRSRLAPTLDSSTSKQIRGVESVCAVGGITRAGQCFAEQWEHRRSPRPQSVL